METLASFEARYVPLSYPTAGRRSATTLATAVLDYGVHGGALSRFLAVVRRVVLHKSSRRRFQDQPATVISRLPLDGTYVETDPPQAVRRKKYLSGNFRQAGIMFGNITKVKKPFVIKDVGLPKDARVDSLQMEQSAPAVPRAINILDISHSEHPRLIQGLTGVTALSVSFDFNLLFFANNERLWVLR